MVISKGARAVSDDKNLTSQIYNLFYFYDVLEHSRHSKNTVGQPEALAQLSNSIITNENCVRKSTCKWICVIETK